MMDEGEIPEQELELEQAAPRPIVALVGRPNVGKSTLFNKLIGGRRALVEDVPGVTRDRHYGDGQWDGRAFTVVDTGGFLPETEDRLLQQVRDQALVAVEQAASIILVVDGMAGRTGPDEEVASLLRRSNKPVFLAINKLDSEKREIGEYLNDFYRLGIKNIFPVSAEHGRGVGDLLDAVVASFPRAHLGEKPSEPDVVRVAIVGRPNVGKSTFINKLLGEERFIAGPIPGTTRDPIDARLTHKGRTYVLTDTAGIRRKKVIEERLEQFSVMRSLGAIEKADVVVLVMDANEAAVDQDARIADIAHQKGKAMVVVANKWDAVLEKQHGEAPFRDEIARRLPFLAHAPVVFTSALNGKKVFDVLHKAGELFEQYSARIPTPLLNKFMEQIGDEHPAPLAKGGHPVRLFYSVQIGVRPPTFAITSNKPASIPEDYKRFIINRMRETFGLRVPIHLLFRQKSQRKFIAKEDGAKKKKKNPRRTAP